PAGAWRRGTGLVFDSDCGRSPADVTADGRTVRLHVPPPRAFERVALQEAQAAGETWRIWTGTEHAVRFVDDVEAAPVATEGPAIRRDPALAPAGANVNFVEVRGAGAIRARTFEKGVE